MPSACFQGQLPPLIIGCKCPPRNLHDAELHFPDFKDLICPYPLGHSKGTCVNVHHGFSAMLMAGHSLFDICITLGLDVSFRELFFAISPSMGALLRLLHRSSHGFGRSHVSVTFPKLPTVCWLTCPTCFCSFLGMNTAHGRWALGWEYEIGTDKADPTMLSPPHTCKCWQGAREWICVYVPSYLLAYESTHKLGLAGGPPEQVLWVS